MRRPAPPVTRGSRDLGQEILKGGGACHAHRVARRALHGVHASDDSAARALHREDASAHDRRYVAAAVRARGKKAHRMDMLALAQGTMDSPCCAPRGECARADRSARGGVEPPPAPPPRLSTKLLSIPAGLSVPRARRAHRGLNRGTLPLDNETRQVSQKQ